MECRRPISYSLLGQLLLATEAQCTSPYEAILFRACFCLAFFAALRVGELVPPARHRSGGLMVDDVVLANESLRVRIRRSKTDVLGRGEWVPLHAVMGPACSVRAVGDYLSCRQGDLQFLVHVDGSPSSRFRFQSVLKRCLAEAGVRPEDYGTHSFRIGAATEAARAGLSNAEVQRIGRWRSSVLQGMFALNCWINYFYSPRWCASDGLDSWPLIYPTGGPESGSSAWWEQPGLPAGGGGLERGWWSAVEPGSC